MDLDKIKSFLTLAKVKNFTKASEELYISQPALSKQIQSLEFELKAPLFDRIGKQTFLTVQGEEFKRYAEQMLNSYQNSLEHIRQIKNLEQGRINFGATNFIGVYLMPHLISKYNKLYPKIEINMTINSSKNILEMLHKNQLEFSFVSNYIVDDEQKYEIHRFCHDTLKLIVGNSHPLFNRDSCTLDDLKDEIFITKNNKASQSNFIREKLNQHGFEIKKSIIISHQEAIKESVIHNVGVAFMSTKAIEREVQLGLIKSLDVENIILSREINYLYEKSKNLTPAALKFLEMIKK
ncbi:MAG: LysR family transcriptional regulator [Tissierellia bacterium]|nr:LysR family transcriptional regulator [Tissierellia bacterium]